MNQKQAVQRKTLEIHFYYDVSFISRRFYGYKIIRTRSSAIKNIPVGNEAASECVILFMGGEANRSLWAISFLESFKFFIVIMLCSLIGCSVVLHSGACL